MKVAPLVSLDEILEARVRLQGVSVQTPLDLSRALSEMAGGPVYIKCENLQRTGSFKIRGAYNRISRLDKDDCPSGVVAASAGNHAQGVALAASLSGIRSTVFMPELASLPKVEATKRYGAEVVLIGRDFGAAYAAALKRVEETAAIFVHPFDHPHVISGQGTIGLEIHEQMKDIGTVVVPIGGGGLIAGVAAALKELRPGTRIVGVQAEGAAAFPPSLEQGHPVALQHMTTIADGIAANEPGEVTFAHVQELVDEVVTVTDDAIGQAVLMTAERMKLVIEPSAAAAVAAVQQGLGHLAPPVAVVLSGGNVDPLLLLRVIRFGLGSSGRYFAFHTKMQDRPGALASLLRLVADTGSNIIGVEHHREGVGVSMGEVDVILQVETKGPDHIEELRSSLGSEGYPVEPF